MSGSPSARVLISASYKTDIPAFYGPWFLNRLRAGYCKSINPYGRQIYTISLEPPYAEGFVFWTKNLGPFLPALAEVKQRGFPFLVQYSINGYPRSLETAVVDAQTAVDHVRFLASEYGPRVAVWRYDPIVHTSETGRDFHVRNFESLARSLEGATDEVVVSFAQIYRKTKRNLDIAARARHFEWSDPDFAAKQALLSELAQCAAAHRIQLSVCSQASFLGPGVENARCIDAVRMGDIAGRTLQAALKGNRPECGCYESRDIGDYDTCPHGCVYCYAVRDRRLAKARYVAHDPNGEFLFAPA